MAETRFKTGRDSTLQGWIWRCDSLFDADNADSNGVVIIAHGLGDHGGRYRDFAQRLNKKGWHVVAFDLLGHGESPGRRGCVDSYDGVLSDIGTVRRDVQKRLPGARQVLLGHSMGGNLAVNYALRQQEFIGDGGNKSTDLAGLVLCAPVLLPPDPPARPKILAAWLTGHLLRWLTIRRPVSGQTLSSDPDYIATIKSDPLMHGRISVYLATQILSQGRWALDQARELTVPTLVIYGDKDSLIDQPACDHIAIRAGQNAQCIVWPDRQHDLLHDIGHEEVLEHLADWLGRHAK